MENSDIKSNELHLMQLLLEALYHDCSNRVCFPKRLITADLAYIKQRCRSEGAEFITTTMPKYSQWILSVVENGRSIYYPSEFKRKGNRGYPAFLSGFAKELISPNGELIETDLSGEALRCILQICDMFSKFLSADPKVAKQKKAEHDKKCVADFLAIEQECKAINATVSESLLQSLQSTKAVIDEVFLHQNQDLLNLQEDSFDLTPRIIDNLINSGEMVPGNGPGATFPSCIHYKRVTPLDGAEDLDSVYPHGFIYTDAVNYSIGMRKHFFQARDLIPGIPPLTKYENKFWTVPKTSLKRRSIAVEHPSVVTYGKMLDGYLRSFIENDSLIKGQVNFKDQTVNSSLVASGNLDFCTIDLSAASDRVTLKHLECFKGCWFYSYLRNCRSKYTVFVDDYKKFSGKDTIKLEKFATMGNVLTFLVEALLFYSTIAAAVKGFYGLRLEDVAPYIYVYGDDIIVPREWYHIAVSALEQMGFKINTEKSFYRGAFRESCGSYSYNGVDVTPLRIKSLPNWKKDKKRVPHPNLSVVRFVDSAHYAAERGLSRLATAMNEHLECFNLPVGHRESPILTIPAVYTAGELSFKELRQLNRERCYLSYDENLQTFMVRGFAVASGNRVLNYPNCNWKSFYQLQWNVWLNGTLWQKLCVTFAWLAAKQLLVTYHRLQEKYGFTDDLRLRLHWWSSETPSRDEFGFFEPRIINVLNGTSKAPVIKRVKVPLSYCSGYSYPNSP